MGNWLKCSRIGKTNRNFQNMGLFSSYPLTGSEPLIKVKVHIMNWVEWSVISVSIGYNVNDRGGEKNHVWEKISMCNIPLTYWVLTHEPQTPRGHKCNLFCHYIYIKFLFISCRLLTC